MTSEKAIEVLKDLWRYEKTEKFTEAEIREALAIAIKVLEERDKIREIVWNNGTYDGYKVCELRKLLEEIEGADMKEADNDDRKKHKN